MDKSTITTIKLSKSVREKVNSLKRIYKYKTHNDLIEDVFTFFLKNKLDPKNASKPIHELITETKDTLFTLQKTFVNKKLNPMLDEIRRQYLTTNSTIEKYIIEYVNRNEKLLDALKDLKANIKNNESINFNSDKEELKELFDEFLKSKVGKNTNNGNVFEYDVYTFNRYMDKIRLILNRK